MLDMLPASTLKHRFHRRSRDSVFAGGWTYCQFARVIASAEIADDRFGKLSVRHGFTSAETFRVQPAWIFITFSRAALSDHIRRVRSVRAKEEMMRSAAQFSIASVAYDLLAWVYAVMQLVHYAANAIINVHYARMRIARTLRFGTPIPACAWPRDIDMPPETLDLLWSEIGNDNMICRHVAYTAFISYALEAVSASTLRLRLSYPTTAPTSIAEAV